MPAFMVFRRELFWVSTGKEQFMTGYLAELMDLLHVIQHYVCQYLKAASDRTETCYNHVANCAGCQEGDQVWLSCPTWTRGKSPKLKLQLFWECPYEAFAQISDVDCRIQQLPRAKLVVVRMDRLVPYLGATQDKQLRRSDDMDMG
jgi:hypothetical protein